VRFTCNICGHENDDPAVIIHRELLPCAACGSNPRFRGVIHAFQKYVCGATNVPLNRMSPRPELSGIGMSDWGRYATELERIANYRNTFYHQEPYLDITDAGSAAQYQNLDFLISSDVLEHVHRPVFNSIRNIRAMLKPGGSLILSVPYLEGYDSFEHYPHLKEYRIVEVAGTWVVVNKRADGQVELHERPIFHGGDGSVLELRVFGEGELLAMLRDAGFSEIIDLKPEIEEIGYIWQHSVELEIRQGRRSKSHVLLCR
jgi:SAM-dependent methyltransferase